MKRERNMNKGINKKEEPKSLNKDIVNKENTNKGKHKAKKKPLKERNKFLYYLILPFKYIYAFIVALFICFWYYVLLPIPNFCKRNYKYIWNLFIVLMIILNVIFTLKVVQNNKRDIQTYNEKLDNITQLLEQYKTQSDTYKQELDTYKQEQNTLQEKTSEKLNSLNKKVTSRSSSERTSNTQRKSELQKYAHNLVINTYGWTENDFTCLVNLWNKESGWNPNAHNSSSGAHGIPQALPASKMASEGTDYYTNGKTQIRWGLRLYKK